MAFHGFHYARYSGGLTVSENYQVSHFAFLAYLRHTSGPVWVQGTLEVWEFLRGKQGRVQDSTKLRAAILSFICVFTVNTRFLPRVQLLFFCKPMWFVVNKEDHVLSQSKRDVCLGLHHWCFFAKPCGSMVSHRTP